MDAGGLRVAALLCSKDDAGVTVLAEKLGLDGSRLAVRGRFSEGEGTSFPRNFYVELAQAARRCPEEEQLAQAAGCLEEQLEVEEDLEARGRALCAAMAALLDKDDAPPPPPRRSLVGRVDSAAGPMDVALERDATNPRFFSIFLSRPTTQRKRIKKSGYALLALEADGALALRGVWVAEFERGLGLSKVIIAVWLALCRGGLDGSGSTRRTRTIDKPLLALSLESMGFTPDNATWRIGIRRKPASERTQVWAMDPRRDLGTVLSHVLCKSQNVEIVKGEDQDGRTTHVATTFSLHEEALPSEKITFYAARVLAFAAGSPPLAELLLSSFSDILPWRPCVYN